MVSAVKRMSAQYLDDCLKHINITLPELKTVLARQRQDYGINEAFQPQYPVEDQAVNVDDTPVTNIAMEQLFGKVDYRIHKLKELRALSQSIVLQQTEKLRKTNDISFREFTEEA